MSIKADFVLAQDRNTLTVRNINLTQRVNLDVFAEVFNAFNDATFTYSLNESNANVGRINTANQPRSVQLGLRVAY
jgi:hypothetical protein